MKETYDKVIIYLTNGFHGAVRLFSGRSHMTSKCFKSKNSGTRDLAYVLLIFITRSSVS